MKEAFETDLFCVFEPSGSLLVATTSAYDASEAATLNDWIVRQKVWIERPSRD